MNTQKSMTHPLLALLAVLLVLPGQFAQAQPLIDQVPEEAALYVGWRGAEDMGPAYEGSHLQGVIEQTGLMEALPQLIETVQNLAAEEGPQGVGQMIGMGGTLASSLWEKGGAMYMLPPVEAGPPIPRLAVLWAGVKGDEQTKEALQQLVAMMNDAEQVPVFLAEAGDAMVLSVGFEADKLAFKPLSKAERFRKAKTQVQADGALVVYLDAQEWIDQVDTFAQQAKRRAAEWGEKDPFAEAWPTLKEVSGLSGVKRLMLTAGIKNKNWHTHVYLDAPAPRKGFLSLVDNKPITPKNLAHVPKSATHLQVFSMDPGKMLDITREVMKAVDPNKAKEFDSVLAEGSELAGFDIEKQLIKGMGPVWSAYIDPMIAGNGFTSLVLVNELSDADAVEKALFMLAESANEMIEQELDGAPIKMRFMSRQVGDTTISHLGIPYLAPSWMVHRGRLYVSLFPQGLEMAATQSLKLEDSIATNPTFMKTLDKFKTKSFTGLSFSDLPETAPDGYGINLMIMQAIAGAGELFSGKPSTMRMPPIGKVMPFIEPSGSLTWVDKGGLHIHSIQPFPGSALLGPAKGMESMMAVSGPMTVGIMLPALGSARAAARQAQTMNQARQIGMANLTFATDHKGELTDDIAKLEPYLFDTGSFFTANSQHAKPLPFNFDKWGEPRQAKFLRENSSFVLVPVGQLDALKQPGRTVMAFQRPDDTNQPSIAVVYADGSVMNENQDDGILDLLKQQTGMTMGQLITRQETLGD